MGNIVALIKADSLLNMKDSVARVLELIDFRPCGPIKSVVVKPNLCYYWDASTGYTSDPRLVAGIIDYVRDTFGDVDIKVAEADASAMRTKHAFPILGYTKLAQEKKVELFNLSKDVLLDKTVHVNGRKISYKVPKILLETDLFINVPKLKIMRATKITCALKNIYGCIGFPKKIVYHGYLNEAIVGINKILHPHVSIVDGLIGLGRYPVRLDLVAASVDVFALDWVACQIMGCNPSNTTFLKIAMKEGLGNPEGLIVRGASVEEFAKTFPKGAFSSSRHLWNIQLWLLSAYRRIVGDVVPPFLE